MKNIILFLTLFLSVCDAQGLFISRRVTGGSSVVTLQDSATYFNANIASASKPFTITNNSDIVLWVAVIRASAPAGGRRDTLVTYNDVNMTMIDSVVLSGIRIEWWRLINPTVGSDTIKTFCNSTAHYLGMWIVVYSGVNQTTPNGAVAHNSNSNSTAPTVTVTSVAGNTVTNAVAVINNVTITEGTNQFTLRSYPYSGSLGFMISSESATGTSTVMNQTLSSATAWVTSGFAINKKP
jgi:hypothetical protein